MAVTVNVALSSCAKRARVGYQLDLIVGYYATEVQCV